MGKYIIAVQGLFAGALAWVSAKLGIMGPVLGMLFALMLVDYFSGMFASSKEAMDHPGDPNYGWNSKKGAKGIIKKVGYLFVISVAIVADYIILHVAGVMGLTVSTKAFFALFVTVWYILNEMLSIIENAGRMGAQIPDWLCKYIAVLKEAIENKTGKIEDKTEGE